MKKLLLLLVLVSSAFSSPVIGQESKRTAPNSNATLVNEIEDLILPLVNSNNFSGNLLVKKNDRVILSKSYGFFDRQNRIPNSHESRFLIGSVSAMFTAAAILQLEELGKLSITDKLSKFIPEFPNGANITVHHLLTERSGLPRFASQKDGTYDKLIAAAHTPDELVDYIQKLEPIAAPGLKYRHSGSSYILLAKIIEIVSKQAFGDYLHDNIFRPLGMPNTGHYAHNVNYEDIPNLALGYEQDGVSELKRARQIHWSTKLGHASIYSTAKDLERFANAMIKEEFLSPTSWGKMKNTYYNTSLGYGISRKMQGEHLRYHRSGGSPGFSSYFAIFPEDGLTVIMLSNIQIHIPYFNAPKIASIVFGYPYEQLKLVSPTLIQEDFARKLLGNFQFDETFYNPNGTVKITYQDGILLSDGAPMIPAVNEKGEIIKFINRQFWSRLEFIPDSEGNFSKLKFDGFVGTRIEAQN